MHKSPGLFITGHGWVTPSPGPGDCVRSVGEIGAELYVPAAQVRRMDRLTQMTIVAVRRALECAALSITEENAEGIGMVLNTAFGPSATTETYTRSVVRNGPKLTPASLYPFTVPNAFAGLVTIQVKTLGPSLTISGSSSIRCAVDTIRQDAAAVMLAGGCDELTAALVESFRTYGAFAGEPDADGDGFALAEAAAVLVIEDSAFAQARGAHCIAEIVECGGANSLPFRAKPFEIEGRYIAAAMDDVLERAGISAGEIGLFVSGTNGAPTLERAEREALGHVFGTAVPPIQVPKRRAGEMLGAAATWCVASAARQCGGLAERQRYVLVNCYEVGGDITSVLLQAPQSGV